MKNKYWFTGPLLFARLALAQSPTVTGLVPGRNGEAGSRAANVVLTFSQPVSTSLPGAALRVFSSQRGGRLSGSLAASGTTLTFDPTRDFRVGEELSVTATTAIQSSGGAALAAPQVYRFRVRPVGGTGALGALTAVPVGGNPIFSVTADVDGDFDLDILTANLADGTVSVRLNNGLGSFSGGSTVTVGPAPSGVAVADVDGDGDLDLLCANMNSATVSVRLNNGSGTFSGGSDVAVGTMPAAVTAADVDGDGDLDLLAATNNVPAVISVRLNNGSGTFSGGTDVPAQFVLSAIATADVDNDGDLDVLAPVDAIQPGGISTVVVLLNNGSGGFTPGPSVSVGPSAEGLVVGDIDNDGDVDLLTANASNTTASVRFNNGAGVFGGGTELALGTEGRRVTLADIDGDGDLDALVSAAISLNVFLNPGNGAFTLASTYAVGGTYHITTADVDGDGDLDLLSTNRFGGSVDVRFNNGTGSPLPVPLPQPAARLAAWPNPTRDRVQLTGIEANGEVSLLDAVGRTLLCQRADGAGTATIHLPAGLPAGTYLVKSTHSHCLVSVE